MKVYVVNYNNILDGVIARLEASGELTDNYHQASAILTWQDVRGDLNEFCRIIKTTGKPLFVMQHGRGATRDYCHPSKFPLLADKILVWGEAEKFRLLKAGIEEYRIEVVGCPLFKRLKPKNRERHGKNVLFVPVIAEKEEPENILVLSELKKWEAIKLQMSIYNQFDNMKKAWATQNNVFKPFTKEDGTVENRLWSREVHPTLPRYLTYQYGLVNAKLTGVHDLAQYQCPVILTSQGQEDHLHFTIEALINTDVMVCLEEGTMQLLACALDIPIVHVDIFKYMNYGGVSNYDEIEKIQTPACHRTTKLEKLGLLLDQALKNPDEKRKERIRACEFEGGAHLGDPDQNIINAIRNHVGRKSILSVR